MTLKVSGKSPSLVTVTLMDTFAPAVTVVGKAVTLVTATSWILTVSTVTVRVAMSVKLWLSVTVRFTT